MRIIEFIKRISGRSKSEFDYLVDQGLTLGENVRIYSEHPFDSLYPWLISVGNNVTITPNVKILAHDASPSAVGAHNYAKVGRVDIGNNVFIGYGTIILCNTKIGNNVVIGAGSVVNRNIPDNSVYAGNPAKLVCTYEEFVIKQKKELELHPKFDLPWYEWKNCTIEEKNKMKALLNDTYGYVSEN